MKPKLYVDSNFKATRSLRNRKAIVNVTLKGVEVLFLKPVAHNATFSEAWKQKGLWKMRYFPKNHACLASAEICHLANMGEECPVITNCHTGTSIDDWHGRIDNWYAIDANGQKVVDRGGQLENVYVSVWLSKEEFCAINPGLSFENYQFYAQ